MPSPRSKALAVAVALLVAAAAVAAWSTHPWTKEQCYQWAAERGSDARTGLAMNVCKRRFGPL